MKITKQQLRRIIKEEKTRLLNEATPRTNAEYQQGSYANVNLVAQVENSIEQLMNQVLGDEDLNRDFDEFEVDAAAANVVTYTVLRALSSVGLLGQADALKGFLE